MDERLNSFASANYLPVAVLVRVIHLPPPGFIVGKRGEAPEDGTGEELDQLGHDRNVVDDLGRDSIENISARIIPPQRVQGDPSRLSKHIVDIDLKVAF